MASSNQPEVEVEEPQLTDRLLGNGSSPPRTTTSCTQIATTSAVLVFVACSALSTYGISYNLVLFMVSHLGLSNAAAASQVSIWTGVHDLSPLLAAYISDSNLGRFATTLFGGSIFLLGLVLLSLSAVLVEHNHGEVAWLFFVALYVMAAGKGLVAPLLAFGADQFDGKDPAEAARKSSFFNWYYFCVSLGLLLAVVGVVYVQDRQGFGAAAIVCTGAIMLGIFVFSSAAGLYRYPATPTPRGGGDPFAGLYSSQVRGAVLVWLGSVVYEAMRAQTFSLFVEQAAVMDAYAGGFRVPPASLSAVDPVSVLLWTIVYDRILVPAMRRATGNSRGFTFFQRMGCGLVVITAAMACAAVLEARRLQRFHCQGLEMSILWQIPQFALVGGSKVFYYVGLIEFMYDQAPERLRTVGAAMGFLAASIGSFLSGFLVSVASSITGERGWIPKDLNDGHLDYFFWLLFVLGVANFLFFLACTKKFTSSKSIEM